MSIQDEKKEQPALFKRLTRLFSGNLSSYKRQTQRRFRRDQLDNISTDFQSAGGLKFKKHNEGTLQALQQDYLYHQDRQFRYADYERMSYDSVECRAALEIYADEITAHSTMQKMLEIDTQSDEIKAILNDLFYNVLGIEQNLTMWVQTMCKYGDAFLYMKIDENRGIEKVQMLQSIDTERLEGTDKDNPEYLQFQCNTIGMTFESFQIAHMRILGNDRYAPYGTSIFDAGRNDYKRLRMIEDAMMSYRIVRSPGRLVMYVDVGGIPPEDIESHLIAVNAMMESNMIADKDSGNIDQRYNPFSIEDKYVIPVRGNKTSTRIESLPGGQYTGDIQDVEYCRNKLLSSLLIPYSRVVNTTQGAGKASLVQEDVQFARRIQRLQKSVISELTKMAIVHLYTLGFRGQDLLCFDLKLANPSRISELQELETIRTKLDIASGALEGPFSSKWLYKTIFSMSDQEILDMERELGRDKKLADNLEDSEMGSMGSEDASEDLTDLDIDPEGSEEEEPEEGVLLDAPGKRNMTTTSKSKGKLYKPANFRGGDKRNMGARKRSYKSSAFIPTSDNLSNGIYESKVNKVVKEALDANYQAENLLRQIGIEIKESSDEE